MKDTIRLIITLDCNFECVYCCNNIEKFNQQFVCKKLLDIDWRNYSNVCITGGEPFLNKDLLYSILDKIPNDKSIYIYTNGVLITRKDVSQLLKYNVKGLNIGLHKKNQLSDIADVDELSPRYTFIDALTEYLLATYPKRLNRGNINPFTLNDCDMPNEDWVVLNY